MIKYRLLCFWAATSVAACSIALAQTPPDQPAAVPVDTSPASSAASGGSVPAEPATPKSAQGFATNVNPTSKQQQADPYSAAESPAHIAIIELPQEAKSEVIRKVVEILEKQGVAKQVPTGVPTKTMPKDLSARIAATPDVKSEEVVSLVRSLQGHGIVRMSFAKPSDDRNVVTVQAPADTPWPVIDNIRTMVNAGKRFSVDVQIATPTQTSETVRGGSYNARGTSRFGYPARPGHTGGSANQPGSPNTSFGGSPYYAGSTPRASSNTTVEKQQQPAQITQIFMLKHADANVLSQSVAQLFDKSFGIVPDVRTNSVIVRGAPSQLREMEALVEMLDSQQPARPVAQVFSSLSPEEPLRQVLKPLGNSIAVTEKPASTRSQVEQLEKSARAAAETLRTLKSEEAADDADVPEEQDKRKAVLRDAVRQTFLARQNLQRKELAEFAARLNRIKQTIEMRDKIADRIIDRRVEELLDPNLKWDRDATGGSQRLVVRNQSVVTKMGQGKPSGQNQSQQLQPAPKPDSAPVSNPSVVVAQPSDGTIILRKAEEFRELLATHAKRVSQVQTSIETWKARREEADDPATFDKSIESQQEQLIKAEADQKFAMKEYETQIQLLESEVETAYLVLETAKQELDRASKLVKAAALPSHELDKRKRELMAAEQQVQKAKVLLNLYRDAAEGI